jgi:hypothetical protein
MTRQPLTGEIILFSNHSLAKAMVDSKILGDLPFTPGQIWRFNINPDSLVDKDKFTSLRMQNVVYSLFDMSANTVCAWLAYSTLYEKGHNEHLTPITIATSAIGTLVSAYTLYSMSKTNSPFYLRKMQCLNMAIGFMCTVSNVAFMAYMAASREVFLVSDLLFLSPIAKVAINMYNTFNEMSEAYFFKPKPPATSGKVIEIV